MKKLLIIIQSVNQLANLQEQIELAFSQAAFGHIVSILLLEPAVESIYVKKASSSSINPIKQLAAWDIYEIESVIAMTAPSAFQDLRQSHELEYLKWRSPEALRSLITAHDKVLTFS
jgi:sulfur relay (sulfurtransferase) DsrF/TusC family protein